MIQRLQQLLKVAAIGLVLAPLILGCNSKSKQQPAASETGGGARAPLAAEPEPSAPHTAEAELERARAMTKAFASELKSTLVAAINEGGPAHAVSVCKLDAPKIAAKQGTEGWVVSRTALRVRNRQNAPTPWQRAVLESWQAELDAGRIDDPATLEWSEVTDGESGPELRYMRAIPLGGVCLACHGPVEQIKPEVQAVLAEQYPNDEATGFHVGDLRGAFVVTADL